MNIKRNQQVDGSPRIQRRRGAVITSAVALLSFGGMFAVAQPASATVTTTCTGSGYKCDTTGYGKAANKSYWTMAPGHNCTNYVAYRLIQDGMPPNITWLHNGGDWAARPASTTFRWTRRPRSDPLHSGTAEQVASVPRATSPT